MHLVHVHIVSVLNRRIDIHNDELCCIYVTFENENHSAILSPLGAEWICVPKMNPNELSNMNTLINSWRFLYFSVVVVSNLPVFHHSLQNPLFANLSWTLYLLKKIKIKIQHYFFYIKFLPLTIAEVSRQTVGDFKNHLAIIYMSFSLWKFSKIWELTFCYTCIS